MKAVLNFAKIDLKRSKNVLWIALIPMGVAIFLFFNKQGVSRDFFAIGYAAFMGIVVAASPFQLENMSEQGFFRMLPAKPGTQAKGHFLFAAIMLFVFMFLGLAGVLLPKIYFQGAEETIRFLLWDVPELFILMYGAAAVFLAIEGLVMTCFRFKSPQANAILRIIPVLLFFFVTMSLSEDTDIPNSVHRQMAYVLANAPLSLFLGLFGVVIFVCLGYAAGSVSAKREG